MKKIFMMGDSTMKYNNISSYPQCGWGQMLHLFAKNEWLIEDHAENGRSTKSFIDEGRFDVILNKMSKGDYVICQFGHNDEKSQDATRYTTPFGTYTENLKYFADKVKEKGGNIVFATSITRHKFINGIQVNTHESYPEAMLKFAKENDYTCIDLNDLTIKLYNKIGEEASSKYHMIFPANTFQNYIEGKDDHSHLVYFGAVTICDLFVRALAQTNDPINECFLDLSNLEAIDFNMLKD
jgi:lysophospholipase L1-like esterase